MEWNAAASTQEEEIHIERAFPECSIPYTRVMKKGWLFGDRRHNQRRDRDRETTEISSRLCVDSIDGPFWVPFFLRLQLRVYQKVVVPLTAAGQEPCLYIILLYPDYGHINNNNNTNYAADNKNTTEQWRLGSVGLLYNALYTFIIKISFVSFLIISRRWVVSSSSTLLWLRRLLPFPRAMHFIHEVIIQITPTLVYLSSATCVY